MKYFIFRLEITDGEHQYYSSGLIRCKDEKKAVVSAGKSAKEWYEEKEVEDITEPGGYPSYNFIYQCVICTVDQVQEITKEEYDLLTKFTAYL